MKEAGPHRTVGFDYGGNPGSVAARRDGLFNTEARPKVTGDSAQLFRGFDNEPICNAGCDQGVDLSIEPIDIIPNERDIVKAFDHRNWLTVEGR
jgi:hypothetical protein